MKSNRTILAIFAASAMAFGLPAAAQSAGPMGLERGNFYAGGSLGFNDDEEMAWRVLGGYQINRMFAAEFGYHRLGEINTGGVTIKPRAWELVGLGGIPIGPVSLYGKLGVFRGTNTPGKDNTDLTYGAGVQYDIARNIGVRAEWQRYNGFDSGPRDHDADVISVGAVFRFQ